MKNFKDGGFRKGGGGGFKKGGRDFGGGGDRHGGGKFGGGQDTRPKGGSRSPELFSATCSACGKSCEVPFRPSPDKPVYCSACFGKMGQDGARDFKNTARREPEFRRDFRPQRDESSVRETRQDGHQDSGLGDVKRQLASLEAKLNKILDLINPPVLKVKAVVPAPASAEPKKERKPKTENITAPVTKKAVKKAVKKLAATKVASVKKVTKKAKK